MAFGQPSGPPASAKQVKQLLELLQRAGHEDFRDARGPMGFTQRQGAGKFTRDEADTYIEQLEAELSGTPIGNDRTQATQVDEPKQSESRPAPRQRGGRSAAAAQGGSTEAASSAPPSSVASTEKLSRAEQALRTYPSTLLAAELQRRGWIVVEP